MLTFPIRKLLTEYKHIFIEPSTPIIPTTKYSKLLVINVVTYFYYSTITQPDEVAGQNFTGLH